MIAAQLENLSASTQRIPPPWSTAIEPPWSTATRPLSDIRELTEPSLVEASNRNAGHRHHSSLSRKASLKRNHSLTRNTSITRSASLVRKTSTKGIDKSTIRPLVGERSRTEFDSLRLSSSPPEPDLPSPVVNPSPFLHTGPFSNYGGVESKPSFDIKVAAVPPRGQGYTITNHGRARSPVKEIIQSTQAPGTKSARRVPSRTFRRPSDYSNFDILDFPCHRHPRVSVELQLNAFLFVGGGTIEGNVTFCVEDIERNRHRRQLGVSRISVDLLGVEELSATRRHVFLNFANELIEVANPPPPNMVESQKQISPLDPFWSLVPSLSQLPFALSLPLDVGPPPFHSKTARIRYVLSVTALIKDQGRQYLIRSSQEVSVLPVYDPEKALISLPSPLTASDQYIRYGTNGIETIKLLAGLHRQVWVSGTTIFVDIHINNSSKKHVKRIELQLERDILCYKYAAASTIERSASQARIFDSNERTVLTKAVLKSGTIGWAGVPSQTQETRTFDLELPRGHATVRCGKFFEVRYCLNVVVSSSLTKLVTVQLPIVLVHINSLDVVPNSVAQVAAAIEKKRSQRLPPFQQRSLPTDAHRSASVASAQGRAFAAPRKQSSEYARAEAEEIDALCQLLYHSPRKYNSSPHRDHYGHSQVTKQSSKATLLRNNSRASSQGPPYTQSPHHPSYNYTYATPPSHRKGRVLTDDLGSEVRNIRDRLRRMRSSETNRSANKGGPPPPPPAKDHVPALASKGVHFEPAWSNHHLFPEPSPQGQNRTRPSSALEAHEPSRPTQSRKMRSVERWLGPVGWFSGEGAQVKEVRERDERQKMLANWI